LFVLLCSLSILFILSLAIVQPIAQAAAYSFSNTGSITIPDGNASPYPSSINVTGVNENVTNVTVSLAGFGHGCPADVDIVLAAPGGQTVLLMSDIGGCNPVSGVNLNFDSAAGTGVPLGTAIASGTYLPTDNIDGPYCDPDVFSPPAPSGPHGPSLSVFNGLNGAGVNGAWSLYVVDDCGDDTGTLSGGWTLNITDSDTDTGGDPVTPTPVAFLPPPPVPRCTDMNFDAGSLVMAVAEKDHFDVNCNILVQNGNYEFWQGVQISNGGNIGSQALLNQQIIHAVDVFSPTGKTQFEGDVVVCLQGTGAMWLLYDTHSDTPRSPEQTIAWTTPSFPGYTCATLYSPATLVMVASDAPPISAGDSTSCQVVTTANLNLRAEASADSERLDLVPFGTRLNVVSQSSGWLQIIFNGKQGWVTSDYTRGEEDC
jgi:subtilisin-like proprotein convertase family protein